jgi:Tol biopolymer transport system component
MKKNSMVLAVFVVLALSLGIFAVQSGQDLFQKALAKERAEGNLEEAIVLYQKVIDESQDTALKAQAQLRIGLCHEKLGQKNSKQAQDAFQKVIDNYPMQSEEVRVAREKLNFLMKAQSPAAGDENKLKLTKLYTGKEPILSISPDGKILAFLRQSSDIWTRNVITGEEVRMIEGGNSNWDTIWSPDSLWLAWGDRNNNLNVISVEKASSRRLLTAPPDLDKSDSIALRGWSEDSKKIVFQIPSKGLFSIPMTGGEKEGIFTFDEPKEARRHQDMTLSPNGLWIAYTTTQKGNTDIYMMPAKGGDSIRITSNPAADKSPQWSFDGCWIGFVSYGEETPQCWAIKVSSEGKPKGHPIQVTNHALILGGNWTMDGGVGFSAAFRTQHIYTANPDGSDEIQLTQFPSGNYSPRWSPDGKTILFASDYRRPLNKFRVWSIPAKGGEPSLVDNYKDSYDGYYLGPDGSTFVTYSAGVANQTVIAEIPPGGGEPRELMKLEGDLGSVDWSPDRKLILFAYTITPEKFANSAEFLRERRSGIGIVAAEGGTPRTILPADKKGVWYSHCEWSPDGAKIAYIVFDNALYGKEDMYSIWTMNADSSESKLVTNGGEYTFCWAPDGKYIVYENRIEGMDFEILRVAADGGKPEKMNILGRSLKYSPDGTRIAYSRWHGSGYEFWIAENVLPKTKDKK